MALTKAEIDALARATVKLVDRVTEPLRREIKALRGSSPPMIAVERNDDQILRRIKMLDAKRRTITRVAGERLARYVSRSPVPLMIADLPSLTASDAEKRLHQWLRKQRELEVELRDCFDPELIPVLVQQTQAVERQVSRLRALLNEWSPPCSPR
jgi:hypothetical protein